MAKVTLYNFEGKAVGEVILDAAIFEVAVDAAVVHEAVIAQQANSREVIAHTKGRGEVAGSGIKPWKQKGTGRARHGSRRSPIWVGGGITFGPTNQRNFTVKMNKKARRKALSMVLSDKVTSNQFLAVETLGTTEGKTKNLVKFLNNLPASNVSTLVVLEPKNKLAVRAARNLQNVATIPADSLNVVDLLSHERVIASRDAIDVLTATYKRA